MKCVCLRRSVYRAQRPNLLRQDNLIHFPLQKCVYLHIYKLQIYKSSCQSCLALLGWTETLMAFNLKSEIFEPVWTLLFPRFLFLSLFAKFYLSREGKQRELIYFTSNFQEFLETLARHTLETTVSLYFEWVVHGSMVQLKNVTIMLLLFS